MFLFILKVMGVFLVVVFACVRLKYYPITLMRGTTKSNTERIYKRERRAERNRKNKLNKTIKIEVETLFSCSADCPYFKPVIGSTLSATESSAERTYKCENLEMCKQIERGMKRWKE